MVLYIIAATYETWPEVLHFLKITNPQLISGLLINHSKLVHRHDASAGKSIRELAETPACHLPRGRGSSCGYMKYALCLVPIEICNESELQARWQINTLKRLLSGRYKQQQSCHIFL